MFTTTYCLQFVVRSEYRPQLYVASRRVGSWTFSTHFIRVLGYAFRYFPLPSTAPPSASDCIQRRVERNLYLQQQWKLCEFLRTIGALFIVNIILKNWCKHLQRLVHTWSIYMMYSLCRSGNAVTIYLASGFIGRALQRRTPIIVM